MKNLLQTTLIIGLFAAGGSAIAAEPARVHSLGFLAEEASASAGIGALKKALEELGYKDGETIKFQIRTAGGRIERIDQAAADLVGQNIDVIVAEGLSAGQAARRQARTLPIVIASRIETIKAGSNVTGATNISPDLGVKRLRLLKELSPRIARVSVLWHEVNAIPSAYLKQVRKTADSIGVEIEPHKLKTSRDLQAIFDTMASDKDDGVIIEPQLLFAGRFNQIAELSSKARIASISGVEEFAAAGGLAAFGLSPDQMWHHTAFLVDRIFKMRKPKSGQPAELPAAQPDKFELVVNLKTAAHLGIAVPPEILKRADKVIK
jgi:putative tryptophan/tyrosine transport system substrate-binding protein